MLIRKILLVCLLPFLAIQVQSASKPNATDSVLPNWKEFRKMKYPEIMNRYGRDSVSRELITRYQKVNRKQRNRAITGSVVLVAVSGLLGMFVGGTTNAMASSIYIAIGAPVIMVLLIITGVALLRLINVRRRKLYQLLEKHFKTDIL